MIALALAATDCGGSAISALWAGALAVMARWATFQDTIAAMISTPPAMITPIRGSFSGRTPIGARSLSSDSGSSVRKRFTAASASRPIASA